MHMNLSTLLDLYIKKWFVIVQIYDFQTYSIHQKQVSILDSLTIMWLTCLILHLQICISVVYAREQFAYTSRPLSLQFNVKTSCIFILTIL